ncbi:ArsR/SmtB family transcription factor [Arsenicicoccus dermatophilus]|uniref:ArsR/SmtB family transcription factor n=1 Tax=Arsenicicoccus dermatophilus TaxID=1076331 RepID=UPI001F4D1AB2|nr:metalloregulator ArsR/SmtB family transcription factor [Arsenicicoccus dermatophilus]MCH8611583.1 metalloregulator ArsR/SmtB family transcription factor [Arsenicicoccus dermatophilus]
MTDACPGAAAEPADPRTELGDLAAAGWPTDRCEEVAASLRAVADPVRLGLLAAIATADGSLCVCALPDLGVSPSTVSHHLRRLREAGLVRSERRGTWVHYSPTGAGRILWGTLQQLPSG